MRDLFLIGFLIALGLVGLRRPFLLVCGYMYIDIVAPQRLSFYLLSSFPLSLIFFMGAFVGWLIADDKALSKPTPRQVLMLLLLCLCAYTTSVADFPDAAQEKWSWVWKALVFAIFMPATLYTRVRIEGALLFMLLSTSSIIVVGAAKTLAGGGGYGMLNLMVSNNSGMYEGSTISAFAIAIVPLILYMSKYSTLAPPSPFARLYWYALAFGCLLIPIGTQARTGLLCIALMALLQLRSVKRKLLYLGILAAALAVAIPLLPASFTKRMDTIQGYKGDTSAATRLAVWKWTIDYAEKNPFGGGFEAYRGNKLAIDIKYKTEDGTEVKAVGYDAGRAFHNSYFEMLGEQGYPGLILFLAIHLIGVIRMESVLREYRNEQGENAWVAPLATALQHAHLVYLLGCSFVGIAFQPFIYYIVAIEIGFDRYVATYVRRRVWNPFRTRKPSDRMAASGPSTGDPTGDESGDEPPKPVDDAAERHRTKARWGAVNGQ